MNAHRSILPIAVMLLPGAHAAFAQGTRIDPGHTDVSPGSVSFLRLDIDQRVPTGFDHVYQLSKADVFGRGQNLFMRIDGAVTAVFPRSVYVPTPGGLVPEIPPGTIFQIGPGPIPNPPRGRIGRLSPNFIDTAIDAEQEVREREAWKALPPRSAQSLITDEGFRRRRVAALLSRERAAE